MTMERCIGNALTDGAATSGWFVGHFIDPTAGIRSTSRLEAKWYACSVGDHRSAPARPREGTTLVVLITGQLRLCFEDGEALLSHPADYALWNGALAHTWTAEADSIVLTFRIPSTG